jgi:hypothetical protein
MTKNHHVRRVTSANSDAGGGVSIPALAWDDPTAHARLVLSFARYELRHRVSFRCIHRASILIVSPNAELLIHRRSGASVARPKRETASLGPVPNVGCCAHLRPCTRAQYGILYTFGPSRHHTTVEVTMRLATVLLCHLVSASALGLLTDYTGVLGTPGCSRVDLPPRVLSGLSSPTYPARSFKTLSSLHARAPAQRTSPTMSTSKSPPRPSLHVRPLRNQQLSASYCSERLEVEPRPALVARLALLVRLG